MGTQVQNRAQNPESENRKIGVLFLQDFGGSVGRPLN
jgi:hypothetical protein